MAIDPTQPTTTPPPFRSKRFAPSVGHATHQLGQVTYGVTNNLTGTEHAFAAPIGPDASGRHQYEISISLRFEYWELIAPANVRMTVVRVDRDEPHEAIL